MLITILCFPTRDRIVIYLDQPNTCWPCCLNMNGERERERVWTVAGYCTYMYVSRWSVVCDRSAGVAAYCRWWHFWAAGDVVVTSAAWRHGALWGLQHTRHWRLGRTARQKLPRGCPGELLGLPVYFRNSLGQSPQTPFRGAPYWCEGHQSLSQLTQSPLLFTIKLLAPHLVTTSLFTAENHYTVSKKTAPLRLVGINSVIFQIQKKILKYTFCREFHSEYKLWDLLWWCHL